MIYDIDANILSLELAKGSISHAREFGNFIIHVGKNGTPILIEILNASKFVGQLDKLKGLKELKEIKEFKQALPIRSMNNE
jgi:uncharacterized protein YuzE